MRIHTGEKPFKCETCEYTARTKGNLDNHMRKHTGERPFICKICQKSYTQKSSLNTHVKTVHSDNMIGSTKKDNKERPYQVCWTIIKINFYRNMTSYIKILSVQFAANVTLRNLRWIHTWKLVIILQFLNPFALVLLLGHLRANLIPSRGRVAPKSRRLRPIRAQLAVKQRRLRLEIRSRAKRPLLERVPWTCWRPNRAVRLDTPRQ